MAAEENEKQRLAELEEQERIKRLEKARKEKEVRDQYNNSAMGEVSLIDSLTNL